MSVQGEALGGAWSDATLATALFAVSPSALGGIALRAAPGGPRDVLCHWTQGALPDGAPVRRLPLHVTDDRLLGGLSLAATLRAGRVVREQGLLSEADGGLVIVAMAERIERNVTAYLCAALDRGEVSIARDGVTGSAACRIGVLALDEGLGDERPPPVLLDHLAFHVDLTAVVMRATPHAHPYAHAISQARDLLPEVHVDDDVVEALSLAAMALGIPSLRAVIFAVTAARAHAALHGRKRVEEDDAAAASRLVLAPRATQAPDDGDATLDGSRREEPPAGGPETTADGAMQPDDVEAKSSESTPREMGDVVLEAARSAIPAGLLATLSSAHNAKVASPNAGRSGALRASASGGRPAGTRPGPLGNGARLSLVETLRAAAPWQPVRRREPPRGSSARIDVRREDFRIVRFEQRTETRVIFAVDASGSAALQRLAEAKGAVEQVLADCYVRRDHVALVAFRGTGAVTLLPATRSLARVRRCLADLAGGGTTPLAAGIDAALALAMEGRKRGQTPVLVLMTDGRGNVSREGQFGSPASAADALDSARAVRAAGVVALFLDTSPRARVQARQLAAEMGARYLPLPHLDAATVSHHVRSLAKGAP